MPPSLPDKESAFQTGQLHYTENFPTGDFLIKPREVKLFVKDSYSSASEAQERFNMRDKTLDGLDTSGDIDRYVLSSADGNTVNFHHKDDITTVFINILYPYLS